MSNQVKESAHQLLVEIVAEKNWSKFFDMRRSATAELYSGPFGKDYWIEVDPLENYEWVSFNKTVEDIREFLYDLPHEVYYDEDFDTLYIDDPYEDEFNWEEDPDNEGEQRYIGPWACWSLSVRDVLLDRELASLI